jgi:hypothetical protein
MTVLPYPRFNRNRDRPADRRDWGFGRQVEVYDLHYSQNSTPAKDGPSIGTLWSHREADAVAIQAGDLHVVPVMMDEALALSVCE